MRTQSTTTLPHRTTTESINELCKTWPLCVRRVSTSLVLILTMDHAKIWFFLQNKLLLQDPLETISHSDIRKLQYKTIKSFVHIIHVLKQIDSNNEQQNKLFLRSLAVLKLLQNTVIGTTKMSKVSCSQDNLNSDRSEHILSTRITGSDKYVTNQ